MDRSTYQFIILSLFVLLVSLMTYFSLKKLNRTVDALCRLTGLDRNTLNNGAKPSGVVTPKRVQFADEDESDEDEDEDEDEESFYVEEEYSDSESDEDEDEDEVDQLVDSLMNPKITELPQEVSDKLDGKQVCSKLLEVSGQRVLCGKPLSAASSKYCDDHF